MRDNALDKLRKAVSERVGNEIDCIKLEISRDINAGWVNDVDSYIYVQVKGLFIYLFTPKRNEF